jgi:hypothetical protein
MFVAFHADAFFSLGDEMLLYFILFYFTSRNLSNYEYESNSNLFIIRERF